MNKEIITGVLTVCLMALVVAFTMAIGVKMVSFIANAQITHEATITASVPLWYEVSTSSDTVFIRTNGSVRVSNPENNYQ